MAAEHERRCHGAQREAASDPIDDGYPVAPVTPEEDAAQRRLSDDLTAGAPECQPGDGAGGAAIPREPCPCTTLEPCHRACPCADVYNTLAQDCRRCDGSGLLPPADRAPLPAEQPAPRRGECESCRVSSGELLMHPERKLCLACRCNLRAAEVLRNALEHARSWHPDTLAFGGGKSVEVRHGDFAWALELALAALDPEPQP